MITVEKRAEFNGLRVAIVTDNLTQYGGAERVREELHAIWPTVPIIMPIYDRGQMQVCDADWDIRTSWFNRLLVLKRKYRLQDLFIVLP